jgi:hypothetical protein
MIEVEPTHEEARFWNWLRANGADTSAIAWPALDRATGSRGVMARRDIRNSMDGMDVYIRVPEVLMITESKALNDPQCGNAIASYKDDDKWITEFDRIALYLVFLLNQTNSFFEPYIKILPGPSVAADWTDEELAELQNDRIASESRRDLDWWKQKHQKLHPGYFPRDVFTWERVHWALGNVHQRSFSIRNDHDEVLYNAMVPGADLLNHVNIGTHYKMVGHDYILFPTSHDVVQGEECFNGYGLLPNAHLLTHYGFALKGNAFDEMYLDIVVKRKTKQNEEEHLEIVLRDLTANEHSNEIGETIRSFPGKSLEEKAAHCAKICGKEISRYPTTLGDDHETLKSLRFDDITMRKRFALYYRIGQKELLSSYRRVCERIRKAAKASDMSDDAFDELARTVAMETSSGWFSRFSQPEDVDQNQFVEEDDQEEEL